MTTAGETRYAPEWLALREGADAAARAEALIEPLRRHLTGRRLAAGHPLTAGAAGPAQEDMGLVIRDLGCGTGSMGRWLAPRLDGPQHWILHDHDTDLLLRAVAGTPCAAADGSRVTVATERGDVGRLTADGLVGTSLVTASALLDLLTREELEALAAACAGAGCPALLALSVVGRVDFGPADPLDAELTEAFNEHQRRVDGGRRLLGPGAAAAASVAFARHGMTVTAHASPWRLGPDGDGPALAAEWLRGWVGAACEQRPELTDRAETYLGRRLAACEAGELRVVVHHSDVLALPAGGPAGGTS